MYTIGSCFSGIGGFELGLEWAGFKTAWQIEIDPFCRQILKKHWPDVPKYKDINEIKTEEIKDVGIICGGYPCQPFSFAGKRTGEKDDRHLWPEMFEIIKAKRPNWVICENVTGHISLGLSKVLSDLESISYNYQTFIIPACSVNAAHQRNRIWIVANIRENSDNIKRTIYKNKNILVQNSRDKIKIWGEYNRICQSSNWSPEEYVKTERSFCREIHGVSSKLDETRVAALGNAIDPRIAYQIGLAIIQTEKEYKTNDNI